MTAPSTARRKAGLPSLATLRNCTCCPRLCGADRFGDKLGYCGTHAGFEVASICAHRGEEPVISGRHGICNIFFTGCNMRCVYCQNFQISRRQVRGADGLSTLPQIVERVGGLLRGGCHAVGFVSPSHCVPQVRAIIDALRWSGHQPVFVFNTSAYDTVETVASFDGIMNVWLPDLKYVDEGLARAYSGARDYPRTACAAIREMFRQKGASIHLNDRGEITSGLIIRHLVLPGHVKQSQQVLRWIAEELSPSVHVSLMAQYGPTPQVADHLRLGRTLLQAEYEGVQAELDRLGFYRGWTQELDSPSSYAPDFTRGHPFEPDASCP